jgi:predicted amidohydrolase YtcJ
MRKITARAFVVAALLGGFLTGGEAGTRASLEKSAFTPSVVRATVSDAHEGEGAAMCLTCELVQGLASTAGGVVGPRPAVAADAPATPAAKTEPAGGTVATGTASDASPASVVFRGGRVYTVDPKRPWAEAVAIRDGAIVAVGSDQEIAKFTGPDTTVVELVGRMMLPGFVEAHMHPLVGSFFAAGVDLQLGNREQALDAIARHARENPEGPVRGFGWRVDMFPPEGPNRADLDRIVSDRPVILFAIDVHSLWVNSKALEIAGIDRNTPDPVPGFSFYVRDEEGEPTGYVLELPALTPIIEAVVPMSRENADPLFASWAARAAATGITTVFDAGAPPLGDDPEGMLQVYTDLARSGRLPFRVVASHVLKGAPVDGAVADVAALDRRFSHGVVQARVLKIIGDGTPEGYTAWLIEPYADRPGDVGKSPFSVEDWKTAVRVADAAGIDLHIHAIGERTTRVALDAIEEAIRVNPPRDRRHTLAHLVYVEDEDIPRFAKLGVIAQFSANWMSADPSTLEVALQRYGPRRQRKMFRVRSVLESGGEVSFGTDWPAAGYFSTYKPLDSLQVAVTRQLVGKPGAPVLEPAGERLDLAQAIRASTMGGARQLRLDHQIGSIEVGKRADLVVLERNLFDIDPHEIAQTRVDMTMMDGRFTHGTP